jgi:epoxyqueuosine reductase
MSVKCFAGSVVAPSDIYREMVTRTGRLVKQIASAANNGYSCFMHQLTADLKSRARALGFDMVGVVPAQPGLRLAAYLRWIAAEMHGEMGYLARPDRLLRRRDLQVILPRAVSLVCVGMSYFTRRPPAAVNNDPSRGRISNYAWQQDYHEVMTPRLRELAKWLAQETGSAEVQSKVYVDTGAILERDHAETAGLGFTGKNTMLITPRRGSFFFLGELITTAALTPDAPAVGLPSCGSCTRCLAACPTDAFPQPYVLDARRCISYLTIELKGWIPRDLRPLIGNWIYGCDICQTVCPFNRFATPTAERAFFPSVEDPWQETNPFLLDLLCLEEAEFRERFAGSPIKRIKRRRFLRNVCVAAGNWGSETAVPPLIELLDDAEPLIRGHAAWALGQIGAPAGITAVQAARSRETDDTVRAEMAAVMAAG